jgi:hypothetical protein
VYKQSYEECVLSITYERRFALSRLRCNSWKHATDIRSNQVVPSVEPNLKKRIRYSNRPLHSLREDESSERETKAAGVKTDQTDGYGGSVIRPTDQRSVISNCKKNLKVELNSSGPRSSLRFRFHVLQVTFIHRAYLLNNRGRSSPILRRFISINALDHRKACTGTSQQPFHWAADGKMT